jgi:hypothetical protein
MKRLRGVVLLLASASGCMSTEGGGATGVYMSQAFNNHPDGGSGVRVAMNAPGMVGPRGQPVAMTAPADTSSMYSGEALAKQVITQSLPPEIVQQIAYQDGKGGSGLMQAQAFCPPGGCPAGACAAPPGMQGGPNGLPMMLPGSLTPPGMSGPAMGPMPGVPPMPGMAGGPPAGIPGVVAAVGALTGPPVMPFGAQRTEIRFVDPKGMKISWFAPKPDGKAGFGANFLDVPGRYNFLQCAIYRLKLSEIPGFPGLELYPTLEVVPATAKTATFLAHSAVPISFTQEDLDQVRAGNYVVKVIYLPDPQFQDLAATGPDEVVSSRLEPGVDPITEAQRRGCILAVVRLGNIDLEAPNTPAMDAPPPGMLCQTPGMPGMPGMPPGMQGMAGMPGMPGPGGMMLPGAGNGGRMGQFGPPMNGRQPMLPPGYGGPQAPTMLPPSIPPAAAIPPGGAMPNVPALPTSNGPAGR